MGDDVVVFFVGCQVCDLIQHLAVFHSAVGSFDKAILINAGISAQRPNQANVGPFRCLDRAHSAVVGMVYVPDFETSPLTRKPARTQSAQPPFVRQLRQRIGLIHKLGQLAGAEELLDRRNHRADIDQRHGRDDIHVLDGHPLPDHPLHTAEPNPKLVLQELAHGFQPAVAQMVDVIGEADAVRQIGQIIDCGENVIFKHCLLAFIRLAVAEDL